MACEPKDPFGIYSLADLEALALSTNAGNSHLGETWKLYVDINMSQYKGTWPRIGGAFHNFSGSFDGQGHVIRNFTMSSNSVMPGLFGYTGNGTFTSPTTVISNLAIINAAVSSGLNDGAGILCAECTPTIFRNILITGTIDVNTDGKGGAFIGKNGPNRSGCIIEDCYTHVLPLNKRIFGISPRSGNYTMTVRRVICNAGLIEEGKGYMAAIGAPISGCTYQSIVTAFNNVSNGRIWASGATLSNGGQNWGYDGTGLIGSAIQGESSHTGANGGNVSEYDLRCAQFYDSSLPYPGIGLNGVYWAWDGDAEFGRPYLRTFKNIKEYMPMMPSWV